MTATELIVSAEISLSDALATLGRLEEYLTIHPQGHLLAYYATEKALSAARKLRDNYHIERVQYLAATTDARAPTPTVFGDRTGD